MKWILLAPLIVSMVICPPISLFVIAGWFIHYLVKTKAAIPRYYSRRIKQWDSKIRRLEAIERRRR